MLSESEPNICPIPRILILNLDFLIRGDDILCTCNYGQSFRSAPESARSQTHNAVALQSESDGAGLRDYRGALSLDQQQASPTRTAGFAEQRVLLAACLGA